jgi:phosphoribosyl 1,2-cyclic phosphodiesterase
VLVEVEGAPPLILDLGTGLRSLGQYFDASSSDERPLRATVLLSHLHYDHVLGLPFFSPLRHPGTVLDIHGPSQVGGTLHDVISDLVQPPFFPIHLGEFPGTVHIHDQVGSERFDVGPISVSVRRIPHVGNTLGFRIEADGRAVAYLPDHQAPPDQTTVDESVLALCDGADLVIHDAQYTDAEFRRLTRWGHSTVDYAVRVASQAGARGLSLFHHDPAHSDDQIDAMLAHARQLAVSLPTLEVAAAVEGSAVELGALR